MDEKDSLAQDEMIDNDDIKWEIDSPEDSTWAEQKTAHTGMVTESPIATTHLL